MSDTASGHISLPAKAAAGLTAIIVVSVVGYLVLAFSLGLTAIYAGLLFLWYWAAIQGAKFEALPATLVGAGGGVAAAWIIKLLSVALVGATALAAILALIVVAIFAQLRGWLPILINNAFMLYLTIASTPLVQKHENLGLLACALLLGGMYFSAVIFIVSKLAPPATGASTSRPPPLDEP